MTKTRVLALNRTRSIPKLSSILLVYCSLQPILIFSLTFSGVVMIRADLYKGKPFNNFVEPGRDAQPRKDDRGFVIDHGNVGKRRSLCV